MKNKLNSVVTAAGFSRGISILSTLAIAIIQFTPYACAGEKVTEVPERNESYISISPVFSNFGTGGSMSFNRVFEEKNGKRMGRVSLAAGGSPTGFMGHISVEGVDPTTLGDDVYSKSQFYRDIGFSGLELSGGFTNRIGKTRTNLELLGGVIFQNNEVGENLSEGDHYNFMSPLFGARLALETYVLKDRARLFAELKGGVLARIGDDDMSGFYNKITAGVEAKLGEILGSNIKFLGEVAVTNVGTRYSKSVVYTGVGSRSTQLVQMKAGISVGIK